MIFLKSIQKHTLSFLPHFIITGNLDIEEKCPLIRQDDFRKVTS